MNIPTLTTNRLVLRGLRASDWDALAELNADPAVRQWLGGELLTREQSWEQLDTFLGQWALRGYGIFAVEVGGHFAGRVGILQWLDRPEPELAWTLAQSFWGKGLAAEAAAEVRRWVFNTLEWTRLVSFIAPGNTRSRRVAEKLAAVQDGQITLRGSLVDVWVHADRR